MLDDRVSRLLDEQAIRDRLVAFHLAYDVGDWTRVRACVASDWRMEGLAVIGADAIVAAQQAGSARERDIRAQHILGNILVEIKGDDAEASVYQTVYRCARGKLEPALTSAGTRNHYRLRRTERGEWLVCWTSVEPLWLEGQPVHG